MIDQDYGTLLPLWLAGSALVVVIVGLVTRLQSPPSTTNGE